MARKARKKDLDVSKDRGPEATENRRDAPSDVAKLLVRWQSQIKVIHGANEDTFDGLVGRKVAEVKDALTEAFTIPANAASFVNGERVDGEYVLKEDDVLEFIRTAGVKPSERTDDRE